jgi:hypothetical protein
MDDTTGQPDAEVAYENTADEQWARQALDLYQQRLLQVEAFDTEGVVSAHIWGTCPRCGHELNNQAIITVPITGVRGGRELWATLAGRDTPAASGIPDTVEVGCGCGYTHLGAPGQVTGCGVSFRLPTAPPTAPPGTS